MDKKYFPDTKPGLEDKIFWIELFTETLNLEIVKKKEIPQWQFLVDKNGINDIFLGTFHLSNKNKTTFKIRNLKSKVEKWIKIHNRATNDGKETIIKQ